MLCPAAAWCLGCGAALGDEGSELFGGEVVGPADLGVVPPAAAVRLDGANGFVEEDRNLVCRVQGCCHAARLSSSSINRSMMFCAGKLMVA